MRKLITLLGKEQNNSMSIEWDMHNFAYNMKIKVSSSISADFNNGDENLYTFIHFISPNNIFQNGGAEFFENQMSRYFNNLRYS